MGSLCDMSAMDRAYEIASTNLNRALRAIHHEGWNLYDIDFEINEEKDVTVEFVLRNAVDEEKRIEVVLITDPDDERLWSDEEEEEGPQDCCPFCGADDCDWDCEESRPEEGDVDANL